MSSSLVMIAPLLFALYTSLESPPDYLHWVAPTALTLSNYRYVIDNAPIARWYFNTAFITVGVMVGAVVVNTMAGYALARLRFPGRTVSFLVVLGVLMVPLQAILIPLYLLVAQLGWLNSYQSLIVPFMANPFLIFLMRQSFVGLPRDIEDSAAIDGAGRFRTFLRIAVPLTMSGIATQAVLAGTWTWNSFMVPVTFTTNPSYFVLTVGLNTLQSQFYTLQTVQMAGVVLLTVPVIAMFLFFQRLIVPSFATAGIKG
ncbi:MAG: carbohydrate ABC transporter permease [Acidimicrobiales bacterium]